MDRRLDNIVEKIKKGEEFCVYESRDAYECLLETMGKWTEYNSLNPATDGDKQIALLKDLFGRTGDFLAVAPPFYCTIGKFISVGDNLQCGSGVNIQDLGGVTIGDNVMIGPGTSISSSGHVTDWKRRIEGWSYAHPIVIGNNVFVGANSVICSSQSRGVHIGDNAVIGAGSVVTQDIPANVLAVGNPCRVVRRLDA